MYGGYFYTGYKTYSALRIILNVFYGNKILSSIKLIGFVNLKIRYNSFLNLFLPCFSSEDI